MGGLGRRGRVQGVRCDKGGIEGRAAGDVSGARGAIPDPTRGGRRETFEGIRTEGTFLGSFLKYLPSDVTDWEEEEQEKYNEYVYETRTLPPSYAGGAARCLEAAMASRMSRTFGTPIRMALKMHGRARVRKDVR